MKHKKVSIIIPTLNRSNYLDRTIQSALSQDYEDIEVIIADNASSDDTKDMIKKYKHDKRVLYFRNNYTINRAANWNKALMKYASGEYILLLPDDDRLIDSSYISKAMRLVDKDPSIVVVFANYQEVDLITHVILRRIQVNLATIFDGKWFWLHYFEKRDGIVGVGCPQLTTLYSKRIAKKVGGYFLDILSPDTLLVLHIILHGRVAFIPDIVAEYGVHPLNASKESNILILYKDLQYIKSSAEYALHMGVRPTDVRKWKKRLMTFRMKGIWSKVLSKGDFSSIYELLKLIEKEDFKYLGFTIFRYGLKNFKWLLCFARNSTDRFRYRIYKNFRNDRNQEKL